MTDSNYKSGNDNDQPRDRFRAVPPQASSPHIPVKEMTKPSTDSSEPQPQRSYTGWLIFGTILVVCGAVSQISITPHVRAEAWLQPDPQAHLQMYAQTDAKVIDVLVEPDQEVQKDKPLLILETENLEEEIKQWKIRRLENKVEIDSAQQIILTSQARMNAIQNNIAQVQQRVDRLQEELDNIKKGIMPPEIAGYEAQLASFEMQSNSMQTTIDRYTGLLSDNAVSKEQVDSLKRQKFSIDAQIGEFKSAQGSMIRRLRDELLRNQEELSRLQNSYPIAMQEYQAAQDALKSRLPIQETLNQEIDDRSERQQKFTTVSAAISGVVITQDLYALKGKILRKGDPILEIADTQKLVAVIEVKQEDSDLVKAGANVKFNLPEPSLPPVNTKIEKIIRVVKSDETLKQSVVRVVAKIVDEEEKLQPGAKMYARIESSERITIGGQAWRQFTNIFKIKSL